MNSSVAGAAGVKIKRGKKSGRGFVQICGTELHELSKDKKFVKSYSISGLNVTQSDKLTLSVISGSDSADSFSMIFRDVATYALFSAHLQADRDRQISLSASDSPKSPSASGSQSRPSKKSTDEVSRKPSSLFRRSVKFPSRSGGDDSPKSKTTAVTDVENEPLDWDEVLNLILQDNVAGLQEILDEHPELVSAVEKLGWTALHHAAKERSYNVLQFLIQKGGSMSTLNENSTTPFHYLIDGACMAASEIDVLKLVELAMTPGILGIGNEAGDTPLHRVTAACVGSPKGRELLTFLLGKGADVNVSNKKGNTPLLIAVWNKDIDTVKLLLENGADFTQKSAKGDSALSAAKEVGSKDLESLLESLFEERRSRQITNIIKEIIATEEDYVRDLGVALEIFRVPMKSECHLNERGVDALFWNMPDILKVSADLLADLKLIRLDEINKACVGGVFVKHMANIKRAYIDWCSNQAITSRTLKVMRSHPFIDQWLELKRARPETNRQDIGSFIIKPLQRACRYPLLLRELIKFSKETNPDYANLEKALSSIQALVSEANELKRVADIEQEVVDNLVEQGVTLPPEAELVRSGNIAVMGTKVDTYYLFSEAFILASPSTRGKMKPIHVIQFLKKPQIWNIENYEGGDKNLVDAFMIIVPGRNRVPTKKILCYCSSPTEKAEIMNAIRAQGALHERRHLELLRKQVSRTISGVEEPEPLRAIGFHELFAKGHIDPSAAKTPLHEAVDSGDIRQVRNVLKKLGPGDVNKTDDGGRTAFVNAAMRARAPGMFEVLEALLDRHDCNVNLPSKDGMVALDYLMQACAFINFLELEESVLERLIEKGIKVNSPNYTDQNTPLHYAVMSGSEAAATWLLRLGANANLANKVGDSPLHLAVKKRSLPLVKVLLSHGADPNLVRGSTGKSAKAMLDPTEHPEFAKVFEEMDVSRKQHALLENKTTDVTQLLDTLVTLQQLPRYHNQIPTGLPSATLASRLEEEISNYNKLISVAQLMQSVISAGVPRGQKNIETLLTDYMNRLNGLGGAGSPAADAPATAASSSASSSSSSSATAASSSSASASVPEGLASARAAIFEKTNQAQAQEVVQHRQPQKVMYIPSTVAASSAGRPTHITEVLAYEHVKSKPDGLDNSCLEAYLSDEEFEQVFGVSKDNFYRLPIWKRTSMKRQAELF